MKTKIETKLKRLSKEQRVGLHERASYGEALRLWELAAVSGYSYKTVLKWKREGLPMLDGKINKAEALKWRAEFVKANPLPETEVSRLIPASLR